MSKRQDISLPELPQLLCQQLRRKLVSSLGKREKLGTLQWSQTGDISFALDQLAEAELEKLLKRLKSKIAYFSEEKGLVSETALPEYLLIIDPIDGTRAARCNFESACISVALAPYYPDVKLGDVFSAAIIEIKQGTLFLAQKGEGARVVTAKGKALSPSISTLDDLKQITWAYELAGRAAEGVTKTLKHLMNLSSFRGGCFVFNSCTYAITRLVTGQLDAYLDPWERIWHTSPYYRRLAKRYFAGKQFGLKPYDLAAALLIAREAGLVITDAYGNHLEPVALLPGEQVTSCVAANSRLHKKLLDLLTKYC